MTGIPLFSRTVPHAVIFAVVFFILSENSSGQSGTARTADSLITAFMQKEQIPALSIALLRGDSLLLSKAYGSIDLEQDIPAAPSHLFRIASVSKPVTAVAVMQLVAAGKIDLNAPVQRYLPKFPKKKWTITIRHLLGHQSGIRHYHGQEEEYRIGAIEYRDLTEALTIFSKDPLKHTPGEGYTYTTFGYSVLGAVVEAVSGMSFGEYLQKHIFTPAGMSRTFLDNSAPIIKGRARGYSLDTAGRLRNARAIDPGYKHPGGGIISTAEDMVRFASAVMNGTLLPDSLFRLMTVPGRTMKGAATNYGLGWAIGINELDGLILHTGGQQGATCALLLDPPARTAVMVLTNRDGVKRIGAATRSFMEAILR